MQNYQKNNERTAGIRQGKTLPTWCWGYPRSGAVKNTWIWRCRRDSRHWCIPLMCGQPTGPWWFHNLSLNSHNSQHLTAKACNTWRRISSQCIDCCNTLHIDVPIFCPLPWPHHPIARPWGLSMQWCVRQRRAICRMQGGTAWQNTNRWPERFGTIKDLNPKLWIYAFACIHKLSGIGEAGTSLIRSKWWQHRGVRRWLQVCCSCLPKHPVVACSQSCHCCKGNTKISIFLPYCQSSS